MKSMILKCVLKCIINNCKSPQNFEFPETELSVSFTFRLKSVHGFVSLDQLEDVTDCLSSILFCYYCFIFYGWQQPSIQKTSKKNTKRTRTQKKSLIILHRFLDKNTSAFKPLSLKGRIKFQKNWIGGEIPSENL